MNKPTLTTKNNIMQTDVLTLWNGKQITCLSVELYDETGDYLESALIASQVDFQAHIAPHLDNDEHPANDNDNALYGSIDTQGKTFEELISNAAGIMQIEEELKHIDAFLALKDIGEHLSSIGQSELIQYADLNKLPYAKCEQCNSDMPVYQDGNTYHCLACGSNLNNQKVRQTVRIMYRDASNYKTSFIATLLVNRSGYIEQPIKEGDEITISDIGYDEQSFYPDFTGHEYDHDTDHDILDVTELLPYNYTEEGYKHHIQD